MQFQKVKNDQTDEASNDDDIWSKQYNEETDHFRKIFTEKGTYNYTTGYIDDGFQVVVRGKVVVKDAKERAEPLELLELFAS